MAALVRRGKVTMERLEDSLYAQPLRALRLEHLASSVLNATTTIEFGARRIVETDIVGQSSNTPYLGWTAGAKVVSVQRGGKALYDEHTEPVQGKARFVYQAMEQEPA
jgi:dihydroorotase-like cyclic amidohydrolase